MIACFHLQLSRSRCAQWLGGIASCGVLDVQNQSCVDHACGNGLFLTGQILLAITPVGRMYWAQTFVSPHRYTVGNGYVFSSRHNHSQRRDAQRTSGNRRVSDQQRRELFGVDKSWDR
jgi:hypothetical protein